MYYYDFVNNSQYKHTYLHEPSDVCIYLQSKQLVWNSMDMRGYLPENQ